MKNEHSHPGDAFSYGAAILFPLGKAAYNKVTKVNSDAEVGAGAFFGSTSRVGNLTHKELRGGQLGESDLKTWAGPAVPS